MEIPEEWSFGAPGIAAAFDRHVREQLPWYDLATGIVSHVGRHYVPEDGLVVDVGASTGNVGRALEPTLKERGAGLIALEREPAMIAQYSGFGVPIHCDARDYLFEEAKPDLIVAFLVLMFVPVADRPRLIERMKASLKPGGALLIFDKFGSAGGNIGSVLYRLTLAAKYEAGATAEEIIAKELSLAGVQRPMRVEEVAGFVPVFRFGDFAGFLYEREA